MSFRGKPPHRIDQRGPTLRTVTVLVPKPGTPASRAIDAGSGIVADLQQVRIAGRVEVYYEGNRYDATNLNTFQDRVQSAVGRLATGYPTVAKGYFDPHDFVPVGTFSWTPDWRQSGLHVTDTRAVDAWTKTV